MDFQLIEDLMIEVFRNDSKMKYKKIQAKLKVLE